MVGADVSRETCVEAIRLCPNESVERVAIALAPASSVTENEYRPAESAVVEPSPKPVSDPVPSGRSPPAR